MAKVKFTAGRVDGFQCEAGKGQSFLWDATAPGLALRATANGAKSYVFQAKLKGEAIRVTIGATKTWSITAAQTEARRLMVIIDKGQDPRKVKADAVAAEGIAKTVAASTALRESITLGDVWSLYVADRAPRWGERHLDDHVRMISPGGAPRTRSKIKLTKAAPLATLMSFRLVDLNAQRIEAWAETEGAVRPTSARLALRILKACLNWCARHPTYSEIVTNNPARSTRARESLGKPQVKHDVLQREQLATWFEAVRKITNPVISTYLQAQLITGARRQEMAALRWEDIDFKWRSMSIRDKVEGRRTIPLTPYLASLLETLKRINNTPPTPRKLRSGAAPAPTWAPSPWVFSSSTSKSGRLAEPRIAHNEALKAAGLPHLTIQGLRRSFGTLCEWVEVPSGVSAQIQGHAPQGVREQNYIRRPLDMLRKWHDQIEVWLLEQAGVQFQPAPAGLRAVPAA
jgi:integrase